MPSPNILDHIVFEISVFRRTSTKIDWASDPEQEYIYFMESETLPSTCFILTDKSSIVYTVRVTGIKSTKVQCTLSQNVSW